MNRPWGNLPHEVLDNIFKRLLQKTPSEDAPYSSRDTIEAEPAAALLSQCVLTCRGWKMPAQRNLFPSVWLRQETHVQHLLANMDNDHGFFKGSIKFLRFNHNLNVAHLSTFIQQCSQLHRISVDYSNNQFYDTLIEAHQNNQLGYIKRIQAPTLPSLSTERYVDCLLVYKGCLTFLHLTDDRNSIRFPYNFDQFNRLSYRLNQFTNLTNLSISMHSQNISLRANLDNIIDRCPLLTTLTFKVQPIHSTPISAFDGVLMEFSDVTPRPNIKHVKGLAQFNSDNALQYIMRKFPNLETLKLKNNISTRPHRQPIHLSRYTAAEFLHYASRIPSREILQVIHQPANLLPQVLISHFGHLHHDRLMPDPLDQDLKISINYVVQQHDSRSPPREYAEINYKTIQNIIQEDGTEIQLNIDDAVAELVIIYYCGPQQLPHIQLLEQVGCHIETLNISAYRKEGKGGALSRAVAIGRYMKNIVTHCTQLKELSVYNGGPTRGFRLAPPSNYHTLKLPSLTRFVVAGMPVMRAGLSEAIPLMFPSIDTFRVKSYKNDKNK